MGLIFLCGLPGSGKSAVGALLAQELEVRFIDLDQKISEKRGVSIVEIFDQEGESVFRDDEQQELLSGVKNSNAVIALGGGIFERGENLDNVLRAGKLLYLDTEPEVILGREIDWSQRPLMQNREAGLKLRELRKRREPSFKRAHHIISISSRTTTSEVVAMIMKAVQS